MITSIIYSYILQKGIISIYAENPELITSIYKIVKDYVMGYEYEVIDDEDSYSVEKGFILIENHQ